MKVLFKQIDTRVLHLPTGSQWFREKREQHQPTRYSLRTGLVVSTAVKVRL